jgi:hypothetical protein
MKLILICSVLLISCYCVEGSDDERTKSKGLKFSNPLKFLNKCISDHECKPTEYCDHTGINPLGKCHAGKETKESCVFDRHCKSKNCHLMKCVARKPVRDGPCAANEHSECIQSQYCSHKENIYKCRDRLCHGMCLKDAHCITNKCKLLRCQRPEEGCKA